MGEVDPAFIQTPEHRPKLSVTETENIPVIDLSCLSSTDPSAIEDLARQIGTAFKEWGFFQAINHGAPVESREKIEAAARKFFALSSEEKNKARRDPVNVMGYYDSEHTKNIRDFKEVFDFTVEEPTLMSASPDDKELIHWCNQWPQNPPEFREAFKEYAKVMENLSLKLMEIIALSLGLPPKRFHGFFKDQTSWIRLNYYPSFHSPDLVLGCGRHKDTGVLTILAIDQVSGLEVKRKSDGEWIRVKPIPEAYIINLGDIFQVWSNETYESIEHRVILNSEKERLSYAFFLKPAHYAMVEPLEEFINEQNPPKYKPYHWGNFFVTRKRSNFMKLNEENIQISHFKA